METCSQHLLERIAFRPVQVPDDETFLRELYYSTRDDLAAALLDKQFLDQILSMQYQGQLLTYTEQFPDSVNEIVLFDGAPAGRVLTDPRIATWYLIDIALMPHVRRMGIGTLILERSFESARERRVPVALQVEKANIAVRLYERWGFRIADETATHFYMIRAADTADEIT